MTLLSATRTILCPTDGSEASAHAIAYAVDAARLLNAKLVLVTVQAGAAAMLAAEPVAWAGMDQAMEQQAEAVLAAAREQALAGGLTAVEGLRLHGDDVVTALLNCAGSIRADLIVLGSAGRSGLSRALLGSTAEHVARHAPCPVIILH